jgi:quinol monooxygenase YgiN
MIKLVTTKWTAKEGEEATVLDVIKKLTPPSRNEPGTVSIRWPATRDDLRRDTERAPADQAFRRGTAP